MISVRGKHWCPLVLLFTCPARRFFPECPFSSSANVAPLSSSSVASSCFPLFAALALPAHRLGGIGEPRLGLGACGARSFRCGRAAPLLAAPGRGGRAAADRTALLRGGRPRVRRGAALHPCPGPIGGGIWVHGKDLGLGAEGKDTVARPIGNAHSATRWADHSASLVDSHVDSLG